jgi:hypothetical protein
MNLKTAAFLFLCVATPGLCAAQSQPLKSGTWTGTVVPPEGDITSVTFEVTVNPGSLAIVIHAGEHGNFETKEARYADGKITFTFEPGPVVACTLTRDDAGVFKGSCLDDEGGEAKLTMVPPKE